MEIEISFHLPKFVLLTAYLLLKVIFSSEFFSLFLGYAQFFFFNKNQVSPEW